MRDLFIDVLPARGGRPEEYSMLLLNYTLGAAPRIERISGEELFQRLRTTLFSPDETINLLRDKLKRDDKLIHERLESPEPNQLRQLGFDCLPES